MSKDREMFGSLAKLNCIQERADCPENSQEKKLDLRSAIGGRDTFTSMEKCMSEISDGGSKLITPLGSSPKDIPCID